MKRIICIRFVALFVLLTMILSACSDKNKTEDTDSENNPEENRYINCEPGYKQLTGADRAGTRINNDSMDEYLASRAKEENFTKEKWLSWEQFSMLGDFHSAGWWAKHPETCQYTYLYTDSESGKSWIYYIDFEKVPVDSGVTNIKEYKQWYLGKEILNRPQTQALPTLTANSFPNSNLLDIDPNDPAFDKCKDNEYGYRWYYVDDILYVIYNGTLDSVCNLSFVYNGWKIKFSKLDVEFRSAGLDNTDPEILQKLVNANTYKEAIEELMNPANGNYDKY